MIIFPLGLNKFLISCHTYFSIAKEMSFEWNRSVNGALTTKSLSCNGKEAALDRLPLTCVTLEDKMYYNCA